MNSFFSFLLLFVTTSLSAQWLTYSVANSGLSDNTCWYVNTDANNDVWISTTTDGLNKRSGNNWSVWNTSNSAIPFNNISVSFFDGNNVWVGTGGGGIGVYNGVNWQTYNTANSNISDDVVYDIDKDAAGNLWVGTRWGGLCKFNGSVFSTYSIQAQLQTSFNRVHNLVIDGSGMIWMGLAGGGLGRFNPANGTMSQWATWNSAIVNDDVYCLCIAPDGKIWCGTFGGVSVFDPATSSFTASYTVSNSLLPSNYVRSIVFDNAGDCWLGTGFGGVALLSNNSFTVWDEANSNLPSDSVWCVHYSNNRIWVATITEGIATMPINIKSVNEENQLMAFQLFPNPASDELNLEFNLEESDVVRLQLFNAAGQLIKDENWDLQSGLIRRMISLDGLAPGVYFISLSRGLNRSSRHFIVH